MTSRTRHVGLAILACSLLIAPDIWAFFPIAVYDSAGVLRYRTYRINDFDRNNDGDVDEDEGVEILLEGGPSGFTEEELEVVMEALAVWEQVPQSYASFYVAGIIEDAIVADGFSDAQNTIVMYVASTVDRDGDGLPDEDVVPDPPGSVFQPVTGATLGYNVTTWAGEDIIIDTSVESYLVSAGTIIDNDIVIGADAHRAPTLGEEPVADLKGTLVHELGHFLGLEHSPVNNLTLGADLVETAVLTHSIAGVKRRIGVTPTMFDFSFGVIGENGQIEDGGSDLAPDDISAISWLYPRGSQDLFFGLRGEARTHTRPGTGIPSVPIPVAHIVAWADVDNDETTPRVAVFDTYTSYYEHPGNVERDGRFRLQGLWKQMETESGLFNASYTFTINPLTGTSFERQAPPTASVLNPTDPATGYQILGGNTPPLVAFSSEVLHEVENIFDISNVDAGTPFVWDYQRGTLVSTDTERTIESIVGDEPMFGDPNDVCILNVVGAAKVAGGGSGMASVVEGAKTVRTVRDELLLQTSLGSFIVDSYYKISPTAASYLLSNSTVYSATVALVGAIYWCLEHLVMLLGVMLGFAGLGYVVYRRRSLRHAGAAGALLLAVFAASNADARTLLYTTEQLVAGAEHVVSGTVVSAESRTVDSSRHVVTDIVIEVSDKAKGTLNKQSNVSFTQVGGQADGRITKASDLASFRAGETVVLYLVELENTGLVVYSGVLGKVPVSTAPSGKKMVALSADLRAKVAKEKNLDEDDTAELELSEYMDQLRSIAKEQAAKADE